MPPSLIRWTALGFLATTAPAFAAVAPVFKAVTIDDKVGIGYGVAVADVDGDQRPDLVLADKDTIAWYRSPKWERFIIAEHLTPQDDVCVAAEDIDGDGRAEIAAGAGWNPGDTINSGALFYFVAPQDRTQPWEAIPLAHDPTIHRIRWVRTDEGRYDLLSLPLHGRGNKNGVGDGVRLLAYHPPADPRTAWTTTLVHEGWHATHNFDSFRFSRGQGEELLVAAREGVFTLNQVGVSWRVGPLATNGPGMPDFAGAGEVRAGNIGSRFAFVATIEPMHGHQVVVYTTPQVNEASPLWHRHLIDETLVDGHALACGDFAGQGRDQIVAGWRAMNRTGIPVGIRLYTSADDSCERWTSQVIDDNGMACEDLKVADLDGDGDLDIVAAGRGTHNLKIYFNETPRRAASP